AARLQVLGHTLARLPLHDDVVGNVGEQEIAASSVPDRAFGPAMSLAQLLERRARVDERLEPGSMGDDSWRRNLHLSREHNTHTDHGSGKHGHESSHGALRNVGPILPGCVGPGTWTSFLGRPPLAAAGRLLSGARDPSGLPVLSPVAPFA